MPRPTGRNAQAKRGQDRGGGGKSGGTGRGRRSRGPASAEKYRLSPLETEEEEVRVAYERKKNEELEEEGRRHFSADADAETRRQEELKKKDRLDRISWGEEKRRGRKKRQDEDDDTEDGEAAAEAAQEAKAKGFASADGAGKYFQDMPEDRMGDLALTNPNEMKRILGPSARFAQHAMLLAQNEMSEGASRIEALQFLASLYSKLGDREYAKKALREFGPATGILDIYPLEVVDHLLEHVPNFFSKTQRGRFLSSTQPSGYRSLVGEPIRLEYDPGLRIRGFAIKSGLRPGYLLEPIDPPGTYQMVFLSEGVFQVLVSAISKSGKVFVEEFRCTITPNPKAQQELTGIEREKSHEAPGKEPDADQPQKKDKKKDLTIHFPRRI